MFVSYTDKNGKTVVASLAPGVTLEKFATATGATGIRKITAAEAEEMQKPAPPTPEEQQSALQKQFTDAIQIHLDLSHKLADTMAWTAWRNTLGAVYLSSRRKRALDGEKRKANRRSQPQKDLPCC